MKTLATYVLCALIAVLPGCGALSLQQQNSKLDQAIQTLQEIKQVEAEARKKADVDGDGKLSISEMVAYAGLASAGLVELARRKNLRALEGRHEESAEDRGAMARELEDLRRKEDIRIALERERVKQA